MDSRKSKGFIPLVSLLVLIILLVSNFSCLSIAARFIEGDENPNVDTISRLTLPVRSFWYYNFDSKIIKSQKELDDFISDLQHQSDWYGKADILQSIAEWQIDFSSHNLILYRHTETSGGTVVTLGEPLVEDDSVTINVNIGPTGLTDDMAYYCYAYKVSKAITSVNFVVNDREDVILSTNNGETIVSNGPTLITIIEGVEVEIDVYLWRDFMPVLPPSGSTLTGVVNIRPLNITNIPATWDIDNVVTITHDDGTWITEFADKRFEPSYWECVVRGGPQWETGTSTSVIIELSVTYLTFAQSDDFKKTYSLVFNDVPIEATY
jgi:hypothetical protein